LALLQNQTAKMGKTTMAATAATLKFRLFKKLIIIYELLYVLLLYGVYVIQ